MTDNEIIDFFQDLLQGSCTDLPVQHTTEMRRRLNKRIKPFMLPRGGGPEWMASWYVILYSRNDNFWSLKTSHCRGMPGSGSCMSSEAKLLNEHGSRFSHPTLPSALTPRPDPIQLNSECQLPQPNRSMDSWSSIRSAGNLYMQPACSKPSIFSEFACEL